MKIYINYNLKSNPWGGGNQFLKALQKNFLVLGVLVEKVENSNVIIFDSYRAILDILKTVIFNPKKKIIYRLGPVFQTYRKGIKWKIVDRLVVLSANFFIDLIIFQSKWSYDQARNLGLWENKKYVIIGNAVDGSIFFKKQFREKIIGEKIKLVYTSWSSNMKKGFAYLKFLDENLDFGKYEMTFIGNSPLQFKNIKTLKALPSIELAEKLRENDIFISPVEDDACSNALIEGLASGLPAVALKSGGNPEIVGQGGELFSNKTELLNTIEKVANNLKFYYDAIRIKSIEEIAEEYINAIKSI